MSLFRRRTGGEIAPELPPDTGPGGTDLAEIRRAEQAFLTYTEYRRKRLESQIGRTSTQALRVLPLLLHFNQPGVPGYVDDRRCPIGVGNYQPSDADMKLARVFFSTPLRRTGIFRPFVELVAAMGSVGTIAFSRDSDLDIWVCYDALAVEPDRVELYRRKVEAVERWLGETTGRPVCLFLQSSASIRENRFGETSVEGCGSAMGLLLKEEFYRTHIHLAGRHPFWWLADPGLDEKKYRLFVEFTRMDEAFRNSHYVDLGAAGSPRLEEYFGAAIWQIVKSWKAPLKSVLKMALLRRNVQQGATAAPLCEELKRRVWDGERMDPYRLLFQEALDSCTAARDDKTAQLLGTCFYLKSATKLDPATLDQKGRLTENQAILGQFMENWGWDARVVTRLNNFARWKYEDVRALNWEINQYLIASYGQIQGVLADRVEALTITDRDLTVLGRKLHAVYGSAAGKVEVMPILSQGLEEEYLSLHQVPTGDDTETWGLYRGLVKHWELGARDTAQLRSDADPLKLLAWATRNGILGPRTRLIGRSPTRFLSPTYMENVSRSLNAFFGGCEELTVPTEALLAPAEIHRLLVMPNFGQEEEEIGEIAVVYWTSWGETYYRKWVGADCFQRFVEEVFAAYLREAPDPEQIIMLMPTREVGLLRWSHWRIQFDFPTLAAFLGGHEGGRDVLRRHLGQKGRQFFSLERLGREIEYRTHATARDLLDHLSQVRAVGQVETRVEAHSGVLSIVKAVVAGSSPGKIDLFHLYRRGREWLFIVDEAGNLSEFASPTPGQFFVLARMLRFLRGMFPAVSDQPASPLARCSFDDVLRIHSLQYDEGCSSLVATQQFLAAVQNLKLEQGDLALEELPGDQPGMSRVAIRWNDQTFRQDNGQDPYAEVARRVFARRRDGAAYTIHLTHLALSAEAGSSGEAGFLSTGHYLSRKLTHEARLNAAVAN